MCHDDSQGREWFMTPEEQISKMKKAIAQAIKVMGERFGSTEQDVSKAIQELKTSMQASPELDISLERLPQQDTQPSQKKEMGVGV
jgi:hypothetical protein